MDATSSPQLGDFSNYDRGAFQKGLLLKTGASRVVDLPQTQYDWYKDFHDEFDLVSEDKDILFTTTARYFGAQADSAKVWIESEGKDSVEKSYLSYYRDIYPDIKVEKPSEFLEDDIKSQFTIKSHYRIENGWTKSEEENLRTIWSYPYELKAEFPNFSGASRTAPYAINFPMKIRHRMSFIVDESYDFAESFSEHESPAFYYSVENVHDDDIYTETYIYKTKLDHFLPRMWKLI